MNVGHSILRFFVAVMRCSVVIETSSDVHSLDLNCVTTLCLNLKLEIEDTFSLIAIDIFINKCKAMEKKYHKLINKEDMATSNNTYKIFTLRRKE